MAKIIFGDIITDMRGKIGGAIYSRNGSCSYKKNFTMPTNPQTEAQSIVRAVFAAIMQAWGNTLTALERLSWSDGRLNFPFTNNLGQTYYLSASQLFTKLNLS